ncbi:hypothetical protein [Salinispora fenicalii]|uniref:hypothetical protein n=1 Tax=Salinispora fenicalii TaxID=1137263 RepID=UPI000480075B|nr:hypothetical protein [Salinispora fenicalii]
MFLETPAEHADQRDQGVRGAAPHRLRRPVPVWPTHHENVRFYSTHSIDIDGELSQLDTDGYRPLRCAEVTPAHR